MTSGLIRGCNSRPDMQEGRALGGHQPFVAVAGIEIGAQRIKVQRDVAGRMGAVDHGPDAARAGLGHGGLDREHQGGGGGDVAKEQNAGAGGDAGQKRLCERRFEVRGMGTLTVTIRAPVGWQT